MKPQTTSRNVLFSAGERIAVASAKVGALWLIARSLGPDAQGQFALFAASHVLIVAAATFGLEIGNNHFGATAGSFRERATLIGNTLALSPLAAGIAIALAVILRDLTPFLGILSAAAMPPMYAALAAAAVLAPLGGLLLGLANYRAHAIGALIQQGGFLILLLVILQREGSDVSVVLWSWVAAYVAGGCYWAIFVLCSSGFRIGVNCPQMGSQISYSLQSLAYFILSALNFRLDHFVIGWLLGAERLGVYSVAAACTEILLYIPKAAGNVVLTLSSRGEVILATVYRGVSAIMLTVVLAAAVAAPWLVMIIFGRDFADAGLVLVLLSPGTYFLGVAWLGVFELLGKKRTSVVSGAAAVSAVITLLLDLVLIPAAGLPGAAIASSVAYTTFAILVLRALAHRSGARLSAYIRPSFGELARWGSVVGRRTS